MGSLGLRNRLRLASGSSPRSLVLTGTMPLAGGTIANVRAVWEPGGEGFVQRYETSTDGGVTWTTLVEATYRPS